MKKIIREEEDLELAEIDISEFVTETKYNQQPFYIADIDEMRHKLNLSSYEDAEDILDSEIGEGMWGDSESWITCDSCGNAIYLDDSYTSDYYYPENGGIICGDCVRENPEEYVNHLINNDSDYNKLLDYSYFIDIGFESFYLGWLQGTRPEILKKLLEKNPGGEFIFLNKDYKNPKVLSRNVEEKTLEEDKQGKDKFISLFGKELSDRFFKLKQRLTSPFNDISYWMKKKPEELKLKLDDIESKKTVKQKQEIAKEGSKLLYSDTSWDVYEISTIEASIKYGKGTKWCISGVDCNPKEMWDYYMGGALSPKFNKESSIFVFFMRKKGEKWAVLFDKNTKNYIIWTDFDTITGFIEGAPKVKGLPHFGKIPFKLKHGLAKGIGVSVNKIIEIHDLTEEMYADDNLEKYFVIYEDNSGSTKKARLFRSPETEEFEMF